MYKSESSAQTISMKYSNVSIKINYLCKYTQCFLCIYIYLCLFIPISLYLYIYIFVYPWVGPKSDSPCFRQAEAAVIRAVDVATPATVAVVVAVAAGDRGRASAGFWLGESRHTEMEEWWN